MWILCREGTRQQRYVTFLSISCTEADENVVRRLALVPETTRSRSYSPYS